MEHSGILCAPRLSRPWASAMYFRKKTTDGRTYLHIDESRREGAAVRQQIIATLGRLEDLQASGQLERLLRSAARFADKAIVLDALSCTASFAAARTAPPTAGARIIASTA